MKKIAIAFSSKDRVELSMQSVKPLLRPDKFDLWWIDGSKTLEGQELPEQYNHGMHVLSGITGGPDRAICYALTEMLKFDYEIVGLCENDVLLADDWFEPTIALFNNAEGLPVGAVSARSYVDRILIQRDGYCILHNAGAGMILFTRQAAQIVLQNYRTGWWPENRAVFAQLSGLDIGKWACFHHAEQMITADWSWDTILAARGLATVALTPSKASMIGQDIPLEQQGLRLTQDSDSADVRTGSIAHFERFRDNLLAIQAGWMKLPSIDWQLRTGTSRMIFPHHIDKLSGQFFGQWRTRWSQGFGPFSYVAAESNAGDGPLAARQINVPVFGACAFHVSGGRVHLHDEATGYQTEFDGADILQSTALTVPRDLQYGTIHLDFAPGAVFHGLETLRPQPRCPDPFDYNSLPPVEEKPL